MSDNLRHGLSEDDAPILLVHGLIGTLEDLVAEFERAGVRAYAPDLLGYGAYAQVAADGIQLHGQVAHLKRWLDERGISRVRLVGHSVGGAIAMLFARAHPERVVSIVNVEGNFSLADAFWSGQVARMSAQEAEVMLHGFRADPAGWLARSGVAPDTGRLEAASRLLGAPRAATLQATARSVLEVTGSSSYEADLRAVFAAGAPVLLVAGERSRGGWSVPEWATAAAAGERVLAGGHLLMLEDPAGFVRSVADFPALS